MQGKTPGKSGWKKRASSIIAAFALATGWVGLDSLPKNPGTDAHIAIHNAQGKITTYNISPSDQLWKATIEHKSAQTQAEDLMRAAGTGDSWRVRILLQHPAVTLEAVPLEISLKVAAANGHADVVKTILEAAVTPDYSVALQNTALAYAARSGRIEVMKLLLEAGALVNANKGAALMMAAVNGKTDAVKLLLERGADPALDNNLVLRTATEAGHQEISHLLQTKIDDQNKVKNPKTATKVSPDFSGAVLDDLSSMPPSSAVQKPPVPPPNIDM